MTPARRPYLDYHPGPGDATAHFAEETMRRAAGDPRGADGDTVTMNVSHVESPSVQIAWRLRMEELGIRVTLATFFEAVQSPDPRAPKGNVDFTLWAYDGTKARANTGAPDPRAAEAIATIAAQLYDLSAWADTAARTAQNFGTPWAQHLLATMIHPPAAPDHIHPLDWVPRVQVAAALVVAFGEGGHHVLQSLALGPVDWVVDAAILALGELAMRRPEIHGEVDQLFGWLRGQVPKEGFTCYAYPLACTWLRILAPQDPRAAEIDAWRRRILAGEEGGTSSKGSIGMIDGLNMETYAEFCVKRDLLIMGQGYGTGRIDTLKRLHAGASSMEALAQEYGVEVRGPSNAMSVAWQEAINRDPRLGLAFAQTMARIRLQMQGIDPDSEEARLSHNLMQGKGLDQEEEMRKAQAAQARLSEGDDGDPDPVVFPGQPVARLSDYVAMMKKMQTGDFNGALAAYGLNMGTYSMVAQAWGTKLGVDATLTAKFGKMMAG